MSSDVQFVMEQLRETAVFGALSDDELKSLAGEVESISLGAGSTVVEQGESSSGIYLLVSGRLRAFGRSEDGAETIFGDVASGELVGEMEAISPAPRVATVRAVRDSRLLFIDHETFTRIMRTKAEAALAVAQVLAERLDRANRQRRSSTPHRTISVVPVAADCSATIRLVSEHVAAAGAGVMISKRDAVAALGDDPSDAEMDHWLHRREADAQLVVYVGDETHDAWTNRCLHQADRVVAIDCDPQAAAGSAEGSIVGELEGTKWGPSVDIVCVQPADAARAVGAKKWRASSGTRLHHYRRGNTADLARLGRSILGRDIGVVLSGGGAHGMAHVGVLKAFEESAIPIDLIGGSSFGGIVAFLRAQDLSWQTVRNVLWETVGRPGAPIDATIPAIAISKGARLRQALIAAFSTARIDEAWIKCFCLASNLSSGEPVVITQGSMVEALRASVAIPGVFPPVVTADGDVLVDGGVMNNVPVNVMAELSNGGPIVAVSLRQSAELAAHGLPKDGIISGWRLLGARLRPFGTKPAVPSMIELLARANETAGVQANRLLEQSADFVLHPPKGAQGFLEFDALDALIESGYRYTMKEIESWDASGRTLTMDD